MFFTLENLAEYAPGRRNKGLGPGAEARQDRFGCTERACATAAATTSAAGRATGRSEVNHPACSPDGGENEDGITTSEEMDTDQPVERGPNSS